MTVARVAVLLNIHFRAEQSWASGYGAGYESRKADLLAKSRTGFHFFWVSLLSEMQMNTGEGHLTNFIQGSWATGGAASPPITSQTLATGRSWRKRRWQQRK